jgi:hypothetical protein
MAGHEECVLHSPEKDENAFRVELQRQITATGTDDIRNPMFDFTGYRFPVGICTNSSASSSHRIILPSRVSGTLVLAEAIVTGRICFEGVEVVGDLDCEKLKTDERFYATRCHVHGDLNLRGAWIGGTLHLGAASIDGDLLFRALHTQEDLYMFGLQVLGDAYFHELAVGGTVDMDKAHVSGCLDVSGAHVGARWSSRGALIEGKADFSSSRFDGPFAISETTILQEASFAQTRFCSLADFESAFFHKRVNLEGSCLLGTMQFEACQAHGVQLGDNRPTTLPFVRNRMGLALAGGSGTPSFWRFSRLAYENTGDKAKADASYYFEQAEKARAALRTQPAITAWLRYGADSVFLRAMVGYGTSIPRALASWIAIQWIFAAVYALCPGLLARTALPTWSPQNWIDSLCFSVATFATFGLGEIKPGGLAGSVVVAAEATIGGVAFAAIVVILMRKLMR